MSEDKSEKLTSALRESLGANVSDEVIHNILKTLDKQKMFRYHNENTISLLSTPGKVLCSLIEDGTMTIRSISVYLGMTEMMISKVVKELIKTGLITKTKVRRQNLYSINHETVFQHPDIQHLLTAINDYPSQKNKS